MRVSAQALGQVLPAVEYQTTQPNPCACQYQLPGVPLLPNLPVCDPSTGGAPGCSTAETNMPFCNGIPYGAAGFEQCVEAAAATPETNALDTGTLNDQASYQAIIASLPPPPAPATTPAPTSPAASSPPASASQSTPSIVAPVTQQDLAQATNAQPVDVSGSTTVVSTPNWFTEESILSGIPNWALLAGAALGAVLLFGGRR